MGVSRQQVSKIVKGKENFTFETIDKLEKALDVTLMTINTIWNKVDWVFRLYREWEFGLITGAEEEVGFWRAGAGRPIPLKDCLQDLLEVFGEVWFQDKQVGAAGEGGFDIPGCSGERLDDDRDVVPFPVWPDVFEALDPGLAGHVDIEEDDIG